MAVWVYSVFCLLMVAGSALLIMASRKGAEYEIIASRLSGAAMAAGGNIRKKGWLPVRLSRAGINLSEQQLRLTAVVFVILVFLIGVLSSFVIALMFAAFLVSVAFLTVSAMHKRRQSLIISQLPRFLDHVLRSMQVGKTLGDAVFTAIDSVENPLREILEHVCRDIKLGVALPEAFQEAADTYDIQEMQILALGLRVNFRYGGSMSDFLSNIISYIREREKFRRQLSAMTGETRVSAIVLGIVPVGIGAYILIRNPNYLMTMWHDPSGKNMLLMAMAMQIGGIVIIWRMLKSI